MELKPAVEILIEELGEDLESVGLFKSDIQTEVELKLRQSGFRVLTRAEPFRLDNMPYIYVHVFGMEHTRASDDRGLGIWSYDFGLDYQEEVSLRGRPVPATVTARAWNTLGTLPVKVRSGDLKRHILDNVRQYITLFRNDYLPAQEILQRQQSKKGKKK